MADTKVGTMIRHYHHANHNLGPMEECEELGCRIHTHRFPDHAEDGND